VVRPLGLSSTVLLRCTRKASRPALSRILEPRSAKLATIASRRIEKAGATVQGFYHWPGTGQMFSTARDMAVFLSAQLGELSDPPALREAVRPRPDRHAMQTDPQDPMPHAQAGTSLGGA